MNINTKTDLTYTVWLFYLSIQLGLKHDFVIVDLSLPLALHGRRKPDKIIGEIGLYWLWKDLKTQNYSDFISNEGMYGYNWFKRIYEHQH